MTVAAVDSSQEVNQIMSEGRKVNPYAVFNKYVEAIGGDYNLENDRNYKIEGEIQVEDKRYSYVEKGIKPFKSRIDYYQEDQKIYSSGDNGIYIWTQNGSKVTKFPDVSAERQLQEARSEHDYMNENSMIFDIESAKKTYDEGREVYEIKVSNKINDEIDVYFIDAENFMLNKHKSIENNREKVTTYEDYRDIGGLKKAHQIEIKDFSTMIFKKKEISSYQRNIMMDEEQFDPPEEEDNLLNIKDNYS